MSGYCKKCEIGVLESTDNFVVCTNCGDISSEQKLVHQSSSFTSNINTNSTESLQVKSKSNKYNKRKLSLVDESNFMDHETSLLLTNAADKLNLHNYLTEMIGIWNDFLAIKKTKSVRKPKIIRVGSLIYIIVKKYSKAIHLSEISKTLGDEANLSYKITGLAKVIMSTLKMTLGRTNDDNDNTINVNHDLTIFVEKACQAYSNIYSSEQLKGIKKLVVDLIEITDTSSIKDGRKPRPIIAACIFLALSFYKVPNLKIVNIEKVCDVVGAITSTTKARIRELEVTLLCYTKARKYLSHITPTNLHSNIGVIVKDYLLKGLSKINLDDQDNELDNNNNTLESNETKQLKNEEEDINFIEYNFNDKEPSDKLEDEDEDEDKDDQEDQDLNDRSDTQSYYSETYSSNIYNNHVKSIMSGNKRLKILSELPLPEPDVYINNNGIFDEFLPDPLPWYEYYLNRNEFINLYQIDYKKRHGVVCNFPPSYVLSTHTKLIKKLKIIKCKIQLILLEKVGPNPPFVLTEREKIFFDNYSCFIPDSDSLCRDERQIEKMLLKGLSEEEMAKRNWRDNNEKELEQICSNHPDLNSTELSEIDIPNHQLKFYIKSPEEQKQWKEILDKLPNNNKKLDSKTNPIITKNIPISIPQQHTNDYNHHEGEDEDENDYY